MSAPSDMDKATLAALAAQSPLGEHLLSLLDDDQPAPAAPQPEPEIPIEPAFVLAALNDSFTLAEIETALPILTGSGLEPATAARLAALAPAALIGKWLRLRLPPAVRADILRRARSTKLFEVLLERLVEQDRQQFDAIGQDPITRPSAWLRSFLAGNSGDLTQAPPVEIEAAVQALEALSDYDLPTSIPPRRRALRLLERARLLEPLRILIGAQGGWDGAPASDRFVGRAEELTRLRAFVDELESQSLGESAGRGLGKIASSLRQAFDFGGAVLMRLEAQGGLGKSALMAKFVLDHALNQRAPFPFIYLDFDRAALQPRDHRRLLAEAIRQIGLQFEHLAEEAEYLQAEMARQDAGLVSEGFEPYDRFRWLAERATEGRRALLLVFDTMEVVQYDPLALRGVESFLRAVAETPRLRIVAAGRAGLQGLTPALGFRGREERPISLTALSRSDAADMANALGRALLGQDWRTAWGVAVAGPASAPPERREPLSIRVAVDLLRDSADRDRTAAEIDDKGEAADGSFVARLYERRVLGHINDDDVRRIAWPGLVVRRVTVELVRDLLAPLCGIDPERAQTVFDNLAREVWIVDREGDGLVHRRDLRARTLPLMRRKDPERFEAVNRAAIEWFGERAPYDHEARVEWIYHRLLDGETTSLDLDWSDDLNAPLSRAVEDLGADTPAGQYLAARTTVRLLPAREIEGMTLTLALEHVARVAPDLGGPADPIYQPVAGRLVERMLEEKTKSPTAARMAEILRVRGGAWTRARPEELLSDAGDEAAAHAYAFLWAHTALNREAGPDHRWNRTRARGLARSMPSMRVLAQQLAAARLLDLPEAEELDASLAQWLHGTARTADVFDLTALRTAAVFGVRAFQPAAQRWLQAMRRRPVEELSVSLAELGALHRMTGVVRDMIEKTLLPFLDVRKTTESHNCLRIADRGLVRAWFDLLDALLRMDDPAARAGVRAVLAARDEDWVGPLGYAWQRTLRGADFRRHLERRFQSYDRLGDREAGRITGDWLKQHGHDPIALLRRADEAGDLMGAVQTLQAASRRLPELDYLRECCDDWRRGVAYWLERADGFPVEHRAFPPPPPPLPAPPAFTLHDPQKLRWGGEAVRDGRRLSWWPHSPDGEVIVFDLIVESTDSSPLEGPVVFHLHDTFPRPVLWAEPDKGRREARITIAAYGAFTVGAQVKRADGEWLGLELDLAEQVNMPEPYRSR